MSVQYTPGPIVINSSDFQRIDRGIHWAIKCREISNFGQAVYACVKSDSGWNIVETLDGGFDIRIESDFGGDVQKWLREYLLPALNRWLAAYFPAGATPPAPGPATAIERADAAIKGITIMVMPDGTLAATI